METKEAFQTILTTCGFTKPKEHGYIMIWIGSVTFVLFFAFYNGVSWIGLIISLLLAIGTLFSEDWILTVLKTRFRSIPFIAPTTMLILFGLLIYFRHSKYLLYSLIINITVGIFWLFSSLRTKKRTSDEIAFGAAVMGIFSLPLAVASSKSISKETFAFMVIISLLYTLYASFQVLYVETHRNRLKPSTLFYLSLISIIIFSVALYFHNSIYMPLTIPLIIPLVQYFIQYKRKLTLSEKSFKTVGLEVTFTLFGFLGLEILIFFLIK